MSATATAFTPLAAALGGVLIGLAAVLLLALAGRIAGVSGIAGGLIGAGRGDRAWRVLFVVGLVFGAALWTVFGGAAAPRQGFPAWALVAAGLAVGYGTALGGGCTSGHGVCGLARRSLRSLVATAVFVGVGMVTVAVVRHVTGGLS